jgi:glycine/D-amino acid oxidase-like deaminating enzyme
MDRRTLLKALACTTGSLLLEGCASKRAAKIVPPQAGPPLPRVLVSPDREIRTTVGLRPFRVPGFRLATEKLDSKICVHNYGHGGAGITLSWGTAFLACEEVRNSGHRQAAVVGCGVVGLASARLLQQMGMEVTIYAKALPPETTSNLAGGFWFPYLVFDPGQNTPAFREQLRRAVDFSYRYFQPLVGEDYAVRWLPVYDCSATPFTETDVLGRRGPLADYLPLRRDLQPGEHRFPYSYVRHFDGMLIEPHPYLRSLLRDFRLAGGRVVVQEFHERRELAALPEPVVVNCTGLGAKPLFKDADLLPIKGQLTFLLPQPEVSYIVLADDLYMFPRRDGILLGGTHVRDDWSLDPDLAAKEHVLSGHAKLFSGL